MLQTVSCISLFLLFVSLGLILVRIAIGPTMADRAVAAEAFILNLAAVAAVFSIIIQTQSYFDLVLVFSLLGFVGTVCFAKFLSKGKMIE